MCVSACLGDQTPRARVGPQKRGQDAREMWWVGESVASFCPLFHHQGETLTKMGNYVQARFLADFSHNLTNQKGPMSVTSSAGHETGPPWHLLLLYFFFSTSSSLLLLLFLLRLPRPPPSSAFLSVINVVAGVLPVLPVLPVVPVPLSFVARDLLRTQSQPQSAKRLEARGRRHKAESCENGGASITRA